MCDFHQFLYSRTEDKMKLNFLGFAAAEFPPILDESDCFFSWKERKKNVFNTRTCSLTNTSLVTLTRIISNEHWALSMLHGIAPCSRDTFDSTDFGSVFTSTIWTLLCNEKQRPAKLKPSEYYSNIILEKGKEFENCIVSSILYKASNLIAVVGIANLESLLFEARVIQCVSRVWYVPSVQRPVDAFSEIIQMKFKCAQWRNYCFWGDLKETKWLENV